MSRRLPEELSSLRARTMSEADWQNEVTRLAHLYGWRLQYHTHDSRRSNPGFPDLVLINAQAARILFLELKTEKGRPTPEQQAWIDALRGCGLHAHILRPSDADLLNDLLNTRKATR